MNFGEINLRKILADLSREDLLEIIVAVDQAQHQRDNFIKWLAAEHDNKRLRQVLLSEYHTDKSVRHAQHVADLEVKCKRLSKEVRRMQEKAEVFNRQLFATGLIVHCTGCDRGAPFEGDQLTEERVQEVERLAGRLRTWFNNHKGRLRRQQEGK